MNKRTKTLALETLEQRIALDASGIRPQLEPVREVFIDNSLVGASPVVFGKSELIGQDTKSFVITGVAAGSTVEKLDVSTNQWRNVSAPVTTSNPSELIRLMRLRVIQEGDQIRWLPKSTDGVTQKAFEIIGWDDGSETTEPEGVNVPGAVENLEIDIVGDEVQVTWDAPTTGATVTHYRIHQNPTTIVPSTQRSHTFTKAASPASYSVTVTANSAESAGEATTVTVSTGSYQKIDGTVVDPILDTSGKVLDYDGPNLQPSVKTFIANLTDADLTDADLTGVDLTNANLNGANLNGADLTGASLYNVQSGSITGSPSSLPTSWKLIYGYLMGPGTASIGGANLNGAILTGADLTGADLYYADLTDAVLTDAALTEVNLAGADLNGVRSGGITFTGTTPSLPILGSWKLISGYLIGFGADLTNADLTGADLSDAELGEVRSGGITFTGTAPPLPQTWKLINGYLIGPGADLTNADLTGADLTGVDLAGVDLSGAELTGATMTGVSSGQITGAPLNLPAGWQLFGGYLIGPGADLSLADLTGVDLAGVKSGGITATGTPPTLPTDWKLINGYLVGPGADLASATLTGATLTSADLTGADLTSAILPDAVLTDAILTGASLFEATLSNANLTGANLFTADLQHANLLGATLIGATLTDAPNANLTNADLTNADLTGATLTGATLTGVRSGGITTTAYTTGDPLPTLPTDWKLINGYLHSWSRCGSS